MELLTDLLRFAGYVLFILAALLILIAMIASMAQKQKNSSKIEVVNWNDEIKRLRRRIQAQILSKHEFKSLIKNEKRTRKKNKRKDRDRMYVLHFKGDIRASDVENLKQEITSLLSLARRERDEVVVCIESPGGMVHSYGLCASQLQRVKDHGLRLTACVDKVAASGGYMMACVADRILAAPFAVIGSIGVIAQVPNFNRVLKKHDVDYREFTAGEYKRTVTVFGEITDKGVEKFTEQIAETHLLFKDHVAQNRPRLDIQKVATGEYWYGRKALDLGLVDTLQTSEEFLLQATDKFDVLIVRSKAHRSLKDRFSDTLSLSLHKFAGKLWSDANEARFGI